MANNKKSEHSGEEFNGILRDYQETDSAPKKNHSRKLISIAMLSAAIISSMGLMFGCSSDETPDANQQAEVTDDSDSGDSDDSSNSAAASLPENTTAAVYSQNCEISKTLMECFYNNYLNDCASALEYYGIDTATMSLKEQMLPEQAGEEMTWFDYIMSNAKNTASNLLVFQEAANAEGYTLTEADQQAVEDQLAEIDISTYGGNVTLEDVREMLELEMLATSYVNHLMEEMKFTDEELEAFYQENQLDFDTCSLMGFSVYYQTEDETTAENADAEAEAETETRLPQEQASEIAESLKNASSPEDFEAQVRDYLVTYENYTEEDLENLSSSIRADSFTYTEGFEAAEWAFGGTAKAGDTYITENEGYYSVYYMISEPARDDSETVNIRHILFLTENYLDLPEEEEISDEDQEAAEKAALEACHTHAEDALKEWESGEKSEDAFAELANQYSEDPGSNTNGGLYESVYPGQMVAPFNDWCFDTSRKIGDTGIVESNYGVHVMYFSGKGEPLWKSTAKSDLKTETMDKWYADQQAAYAVAMNDDVINSIEG